MAGLTIFHPEVGIVALVMTHGTFRNGFLARRVFQVAVSAIEIFFVSSPIGLEPCRGLFMTTGTKLKADPLLQL